MTALRPHMVRRPSWMRGPVGDTLLAVLLAAAELFLLATYWPRVTSAPLAVTLALAASLPLAVRRRTPRAAFVLTAVAAAAAVVLDQSPPMLGPAVALCTVAVLLPRRRSLEALGIALVLLVLVVGLSLIEPGLSSAYIVSTLVMAVLSTVGIWALGAYIRARRQYEDERALRAEERARLVLAEERAHLARDLHDVLAHSLGSVVVLASTARHLVQDQPGPAPQMAEVLAALEKAGREGLAEVRQLLGVLRTPEHAPAPLAPFEGLSRLGTLVEQVRQAGVQVDLSVDGAFAGLPPAVDVSAYRIVQEALTNVLRHAQAARVQVVLRWEPGALVVLVRDDGRGAAAVGTAGHGLAGIRERAALLRGEVSAGPLGPEGPGWEVRARLPLLPADVVGQGKPG